MSNIFITLLVDDDEADDFLIRRALQRTKIFSPVLHVKNGKEAIDYLQGAGKYADRKLYPFPNLLITDLKMPVINGFELTQWVRSQPRFKTLPIVVLSASDLQVDVDRAYELGVNSYLVKMSDAHQFSEMLGHLYNFWEHSVRLPSIKPEEKPSVLRTSFQPSASL
jgi:CheY-like chemotaxis protein